MSQNVKQYPLEALGSVNLTSLSSASRLTSMPQGTTVVRVTATTENVRVTFDGTTPTSTVGERVVAGGETREFHVTNPENIQVIEEGASAALYVTYFRYKISG